ncbi:MAG TPA: hypothetical protein VL096_16010 [Pirellulaceae bacterium]|nr:hypothetical protein [Pirellulaceae bacterium]
MSSRAVAQTAVTFPYEAYIADEPAKVHAGPGRAHYATDVLTPGTKVEVLREASGWLAIAPPAGSFSWVLAGDVELTDTPDVAQVIAEDVVAWIGSRVEQSADHVWQVKLEPGTQVKVVAVKRRAGQSGKPAETWYRIEPPTGEFRWIEAKQVTPDEPGAEPELLVEAEGPTPADLSTKPEETLTEPVGTASVLVKRLQDTTQEIAHAVANLSDEPIGTGVEKAQFVTRAQRPEPKSTTTKPAKPDSPFKVVGGDAATPRVAALDKSLPRDPKLLLSSAGPFDDRLTEVELQLSLMVAKDSRQWNLEPLRQQAEQLLASGQTTLERGRARLTLDKIAEFDALAKRSSNSYSAVRTSGVEEVQEAALPTAPADAASPAAGLVLPEGVTYDGYGWLKPVYSAKRVAPPYALVDADGKVLQYVTPAPGLNLNRYVKKPVGIYGQKSFLTEFKANHLTASRIIDLTRYQK